MKTMWKLTAAMLSAAMLVSAVPFAAYAADDDEPAETITATVELKETSATATGDNVKVDGTVITVSASGSYVFSGKLNDGQICVDIPEAAGDDGKMKPVDEGTVKLIFSGVEITGTAAPAVLVNNAKKTSITLTADTENFLYDGEAAYASTNAVIYAKDDLTIKGEGALRVEGNQNYGIHCNNDLKITGGNLKVRTNGTKDTDGNKYADGIRGKGSVEIKGGKIDINANGDGIKSTKGTVTISAGEIDVKASNDAVQADTALTVSGGVLKANGDRSLTCGTVTLNGGSILATATDAQPAEIAGTQAALELNFAEEQVKDLELALSADGETVFAMTPDKKFKYALISDPGLLPEKDYELTLGGKLVMADGVAVVSIKAASGVTLIENVTVSAEEEFNGDIDQNGSTGIADAIMMCRYIAEDNDVKVPAAGVALMDFNKDGFVTSEDTQILLCFIAGIL